MRLRCYVDESGELLSGVGLDKHVLAKATQWTALGAYILPEDARRLLASRCKATLKQFGIPIETEVKAAHAGKYYQYCKNPGSALDPEIGYLVHLSPDEGIAVFRQLAEVFASVKGAISVAVVGRVCDIYDPCWLQPAKADQYLHTAGASCVPPQRVKQDRVYLMFYQTLLQRVRKHQLEVGASEVQVLQDAHSFLQNEDRFANIHTLLTQTGFSWGVNLQNGIDEFAATGLSHQHRGLQAADFVASAFRQWVSGKTPLWSPPLAGIVRSHNGRYAQIGIVGVPKGHRMEEEHCRKMLDAIRSGNHPEPMQ